jgi:hypothetical protein
MNKLSVQARVQILNALSEGVGINATARMTGTSKNTVLKLLADVGEACAPVPRSGDEQPAVQAHSGGRNLELYRCQQKSVNPTIPAHTDFGDCYTFTAIDPDTKLMPCWLVGTRSQHSTELFMDDLAPRFAGRIQLTTDGMKAYPYAVDRAFGGQVDFGC